MFCRPVTRAPSSSSAAGCTECSSHSVSAAACEQLSVAAPTCTPAARSSLTALVQPHPATTGLSGTAAAATSGGVMTAAQSGASSLRAARRKSRNQGSLSARLSGARGLNRAGTFPDHKAARQAATSSKPKTDRRRSLECGLKVGPLMPGHQRIGAKHERSGARKKKGASCDAPSRSAPGGEEITLQAAAR